MSQTAITFNDLMFLAKGAGMTLAVTGVSVAAGTVLGSGTTLHSSASAWLKMLRYSGSAVSPS